MKTSSSPGGAHLFPPQSKSGTAQWGRTEQQGKTECWNHPGRRILPPLPLNAVPVPNTPLLCHIPRNPPAPWLSAFPMPADFSSEDTQPICAYPNVAFFSSFYSPSSTPLVSRLHNENHQRSNGRCPVLCPHRSPVVVGASPEELSVHSSGQRGDESRTGITLQHLTGGAFPNAWSALT